MEVILVKKSAGTDTLLWLIIVIPVLEPWPDGMMVGKGQG